MMGINSHSSDFLVQYAKRNRDVKSSISSPIPQNTTSNALIS